MFSTQQAFMWSNGDRTYLGSLGGTESVALDINEVGEIVGSASLSSYDNSIKHAYLYKDSIMMDLNPLVNDLGDWTLTSANGINDLGQIVDEGNLNGANHAFLLTPVFSAVPEPSTYFLLCIGLGVLGFARKMINRMNQS
jgi:probable HAF family extracellular repeat protein